MPTTTAQSIISNVFALLNVYPLGETVPNAAAQDALTRLNGMMGQWANDSLSIPVVGREVFPLIANKGGPSNPYTIGATGDFVTTRPPNQASLHGAGLLLGGTTPAIEMPRALLTDEMYEAIRIKDLSSALFTAVYYNTTFAGELGQINLWPVPNTTLHSLVLYRDQQLGSFASLTISYDVPVGVDEAIWYNLARRLALAYGKPADPELLDMAATSLATIRRANSKILADLAADAMFRPDKSGAGHGYNILSGTGG